MQPIATIHTAFPTKFGVPRQSGLIPSLQGVITFLPEFADPNALRGLEGFSHIWLLWEFSNAIRRTANGQKERDWSPTVRPPRLGGNERMGVWATRSPFRPNRLGLSCVKIEKIEFSSPVGPRITVSGIDMMDSTPIIDIKPYIPYTDSIPEAVCGFVERHTYKRLQVVIPDKYMRSMPSKLMQSLISVIAEDPRPHYKKDGEKVFCFEFDNYKVGFKVSGEVATVVSLSLL